MFLGCCVPRYFVKKTKKYILNFRNTLDTDGLIFHMDPIDDTPILDFVDMEERQKKVDPKESARIKYLTQNLIRIDKGIYKF